MQSCAVYPANPNPAKPLFCIILIAMAGVILFSIAHATERHGDDAIAVCNADPIKTLVNPVTKRSADVCQLPDGRLGVKVCGDDGCVITAFIKEKMKSVDDVLRYLANRGYY